MNKHRAFTLVEGILVIALAAIITMVIAVYIREGVVSWKSLTGQKDIALSSRAALARVTRELKRIKQNTNILTHTTTECRFLDVNENMVTFSQEGTSLLRNSDILLDDLKDPGGLMFSYLDKDGTETAITNDMRTIRCRLVVQKDENRYVLQSAARVRVRKIR
jgi:type II secretory pathway pseudopilin PulG